MLELIMPTNDKSKVYNFLKKGGGLHHLAYEVEDIKKTIDYFKSKKSIILGDIVPGAGHNNTNTVWLYTNQKELIKDGNACVCDTSWHVNGNYKKGEVMTRRNINLTLSDKSSFEDESSSEDEERQKEEEGESEDY